MVIEKLNIVSFGHLSNREIVLGPNINVIEGDNESGKSTVAAFIKFILYGIKDKGDVAERKLYINWNGTTASGSMTVFADGKHIKIERTLTVDAESGTSRENVRMTDIDTGLALYKGKCPGEALFGVPEDVFVGTAFVRQIGGTSLDGEKMSAAAENLLFSADEAVNTKKAAEKLEGVRRGLLHKNGKGGSIYEKETVRDKLTEMLERAKKSSGDLIAVETSLSELNEAREVAIKNREKTRARVAGYETVMNKRRFAELAAAKDELASLYEKKDALLREGVVNGTFPDSAYINELRTVSGAMTATSASINTISRSLDSLRTEEASAPDRMLYEMFDSNANARADIGKEFDDLHTQRNVLGISSLVTVILAVACAVIVILFRSVPNVVIWLSIATAVLATAAVLMAIVSIHAENKAGKRLQYYGADDRKQLPARLDELSEGARVHRELNEKIAATEAERYVQYSVYDDEKDEARELLHRRGIDVSDDGALAGAVTDAIANCTSLYERDRALSEEIERARGTVAVLEQRLEGVDENEVMEAAKLIDESAYESISAADLRRERDFTENAVTKLTERIHELELKRTELMSRRDDPSAIAVKLDELNRDIDDDRARLDACVLAIESLERAGREVRESVAPRLREYARNYLGTATGGKYSELSLDGAFSMSLSADGAYRDLDNMSAGTCDAAYLSLRLALVKLLYRRETPALVFDESLCRMDDGRASAMLSMIASDGAQALILTCQTRERRLLSSVCPDAHITILQ